VVGELGEGRLAAVEHRERSIREGGHAPTITGLSEHRR
jgi:hypothetical protein